MRIGTTLWIALLAALSCDNTPTAGEEQPPTGLPPGGGQGCRTLRIVYDDVARTFEEGPVYNGGPGICGPSGFQRFTFDRHNNVVAEYVATGGASTTWTHTSTSTSMAGKPD